MLLFDGINTDTHLHYNLYIFGSMEGQDHAYGMSMEYAALAREENESAQEMRVSQNSSRSRRVKCNES